MGKNAKKVKDEFSPRFSEGMLWSSRGVSQSINIIILGYISMYCSDILGIPIGWVGTIMMVSKVFDGVTDVVVGYIIDRTNTKLGKGRPYELCLLGYWGCTVLLFACPSGWETMVKCVWIFAMYTMINSIFGTFLSSAIVPYTIRAFNSQQKYVTYGVYGGLMSMVAAIIINVAFPIMMVRLGTSAAGWTIMIASIAIPATIIGLLRFFFIPEKYNVDAQTDKIDMKAVFECLKTNKYIYVVALMMLIYNLVTNLGITTYYYKYIVGNLELMSIASALSAVMIPMLLIAPAVMKKISAARFCMYGCLACVFGYVLNWFAGANFPMLIVAGLFTGAGVIPISMFSSLLTIECADYNEYIGKPRMEGTLGAITGLGSKLGSAFGTFILGALLSMAGYISTSDDVTVDQPGSALFMIRIIMSFLPALLYLLVAIACGCYGLDKKIGGIREELEVRRAQREDYKAK